MRDNTLSSRDLARRWNLAPYTLRLWRLHGKGPDYFKVGGRVNYRPEDVERFEKEHLRSHTSMTPEIFQKLKEKGAK